MAMAMAMVMMNILVLLCEHLRSLRCGEVRRGVAELSLFVAGLLDCFSAYLHGVGGEKETGEMGGVCMIFIFKGGR